MRKTSIVASLLLISAFSLSISVSAHPGRTDAQGGHYETSTGKYHYHHGYSAHQHPNGICPYDSSIHTLNPLPNLPSLPKIPTDFSVEPENISTYDDGYSEGYDVGYANGWNDCYEAAQKDIAYNYFTEDDMSEKYHEGLADGNLEGYDRGHSDGYDAGYYEAEAELEEDYAADRNTWIFLIFIASIIINYGIAHSRFRSLRNQLENQTAVAQKANAAFHTLSENTEADRRQWALKLKQAQNDLKCAQQEKQAISEQLERVLFPEAFQEDTSNFNDNSEQLLTARDITTRELIDFLLCSIIGAEQQERFDRSKSPSIKILSFAPANDNNVIAEVEGSTGEVYRTSLTTCSCPDFTFRQRPCKHMYALAIELLKSNLL